MNAPVVYAPKFPAMSEEDIEKVRRLQERMLAMPQVKITTAHTFHAGTYARTIHIPKGAALVGALIKIPTLLIFNGRATVFIGEERLEIDGYHVIPASAGRKQVFIAHADTDLTMIFATGAKTIEDAENEFTDEAHLLMSRKNPETNSITITGE